jgi:two-component system LytT family sensor kinase
MTAIETDRAIGVRETIRIAWSNAPARTRQGIAAIWMVALALIAIQFIYDTDDWSDVLVLSGSIGVILASIGMGLLATVFLLQTAQQRAMGEGHATFAETEAPTQVLLALPVLAAVGVAALAMSIGMMSVRAMFGTPERFIMIAVIGIYLGVISRIIFGATRTLHAYGQRQAAAAERAQSEAVQAKMAALQGQTNPHFLFNTLNTIAALVRTDPRAAERTVENLSSVLRRTLQRSNRPMSTVADEVDYAKAYLAIEQERFGDRLRVEWRVSDTLTNSEIPTMTLQPLVENAIKHGITARIEGGSTRITIDEHPEGVRIAVEDDGPGFPPNHAEGGGLSNLRRRLQTLYGDAAAMRIERPAKGRGACIELVIPIVPATLST